MNRYFTDKLNAGVKATSVAGGSDTAVPAYSLSGQRLTAPQRGINIIGGRKVMVK